MRSAAPIQKRKSLPRSLAFAISCFSTNARLPLLHEEGKKISSSSGRLSEVESLNALNLNVIHLLPFDDVARLPLSSFLLACLFVTSMRAGRVGELRLASYVSPQSTSKIVSYVTCSIATSHRGIKWGRKATKWQENSSFSSDSSSFFL